MPEVKVDALPALIALATDDQFLILDISELENTEKLKRVTLALLDARFVQVAGDVMTGNLSILATLQANIVDMPELDTPAAPTADHIRIYAVEDADFTVLETITDLGIVNRINQDTFRIARNTTGVDVAVNKAVYFSGSTGNKPNFALACADDEGTMPAVGVTTAAVVNNAYGEIMIVGRLNKVKTDYAGWLEGQALYVDPTTPGELTNVRPTHPDLAQWVGTIEVVHATNGAILVNAQSLTGIEDGTNRNSWTVGDTLTGVKSVLFDGLNDASLEWDSENSRMAIATGGATLGRFDTDATAGNTRFLLYDVDNAQLERVSVGIPDSGGAGFKVLRIPN
jgi:hypothetical protein